MNSFQVLEREPEERDGLILGRITLARKLKKHDDRM
jgi:hypothetical protein